MLIVIIPLGGDAKKNTDGPGDGETNRDNQKCPKARRLVATSKEIKALEKERCQLIPGRLVTGPAGIPTQTAFHGDGQEKRNRPENKGKPHRRTIYMDKYAATEQEKVPELRMHLQHHSLLLPVHGGK